MEMISTTLHERLQGIPYILVPIRAGETDASLVQVAARLAQGSDHRIGVLAFTMSEERPDQDCLLEETLGNPELVRIAEAEGATVVTAQLVARDVAMCVAQLAGQLETRLILMGWSGAPLHRLFGSNTAKQVLNTAPGDVALLYDQGLSEIRRVLVAADTGGDVGTRIRLADLLTTQTDGAEVVVLRVVKPIAGVNYSIEEVATNDLIRDELGRTTDRIRARLVKAPNVLGGILDEAGKGYDLVLVGPSEQPLWRDWVFGAPTERIVERMPCSVLLVKESDPSSAGWLRRLGQILPLHVW